MISHIARLTWSSRPSRLASAIPTGASSNAVRNRSSASRSAASARLRAVMSRTALETSSPWSVSSGPRLISTGNSVPSLRRP